MSHCGGALLGLGLTLASCLASAQVAPPPQAAAASAPPATSPGPRRMSPSELRETASMPGDLRPADAVTPQIVIPLGPGKQASGPAGKTRRPAAAAIDDSAARCEAAASRTARERCLLGRARRPAQR